jgi:hypothetical protein
LKKLNKIRRLIRFGVKMSSKCNEEFNPIAYVVCRIRDLEAECKNDKGKVNPWCIVEKVTSKALNMPELWFNRTYNSFYFLGKELKRQRLYSLRI